MFFLSIVNPTPALTDELSMTGRESESLTDQPARATSKCAFLSPVTGTKDRSPDGRRVQPEDVLTFVATEKPIGNSQIFWRDFPVSKTASLPRRVVKPLTSSDVKRTPA